jgi:pimeloyl-ACP methyl ester carboxylesterase
MPSTLYALTFGHVIISLIAIASGFLVVRGFLTARRDEVWTGIFLATTAATSVTGFFFPFERFLPSHLFGILSLILLPLPLIAQYSRQLRGAWRWIFVASSMILLYLNVFVLVVQLFLKVPVLSTLAPTQTELSFLLAQLLTLCLFIWLTVLSIRGYRVSSIESVARDPLPFSTAPALPATVPTDRVASGPSSPIGRTTLSLTLLAVLAASQGFAQEANADRTKVPRLEALPPGFTQQSALVNGVRIHYKVGGQGPAVVLLHGYTQTSHMWRPLLPLLSGAYTVIAPDLRGIGDSERTTSGYDKKTMAQDIHALVQHLGHRGLVSLVGHDIGLMVAYAYTAQYPSEVSKVVLMDAFLPGVGDWKSVWLMRDLWHFHFYGETPLALVKGRERTYFEHFWNDFAADKNKSVPEADRQFYAAAYARDEGMRAGFEVFKNFEQDAKDFAQFSATKLDMPFLVLTGEKASGTTLIDQTRQVAKNVTGIVVKGSGHWLMEEAPHQVIPEIVSFLDGTSKIRADRVAPRGIR